MIPAGSGAGHAAPTTPAALVNVIPVSVAVPATAALPVQTVPFAAVPEKVTCPSIAEPFMVAVTCPLQLTDVDAQVPRTSDPVWVSSSLTCSVELFDDAMQAFQRHAAIERVLIDEGWTLEGFESVTGAALAHASHGG